MPCLRLTIAALVLVGALAPRSSAQVAPLQRTPAPAAPTPAQPPERDALMKPPEREALMTALLAFVLDEYLGNGRADHVNRADMYASLVTYYARGRISRAAVMSDKASYYRRWPSRVYAYVPDTLRIDNAGDAGVTVVFRHSFVVMNGAERRTGVAITRLGVTLEDGRFVIVRETGAIDRRGI